MLRKLIIGAIVGNFVFMLASVIGPIGLRFKDAAVADNATAQYGAGADVSASLELNAQLHPLVLQNSTYEVDWSTNATSLNYGTLINKNGVLFGETGYAAIFIPATSGRPYEVVWSGTALDGPGGAKIGTGGNNVTGSTEDAYLVVPDYQWKDEFSKDNPQKDCPGIVGPILRTAGIGKIYTSDFAGVSRIIRAYVGIGGPPGEGDTVLDSDGDGKKDNASKGHDGPTPKGTIQNYEHGVWDIVNSDQKTGHYSGSITFTVNLI